MDRDGLAQIGECVERGELRLARVAGDGVAILGRDSNAATEPQIEADGAVAPDKIRERFAFGQAVGG